MQQLDRNDYERIIEDARRQRSEALGRLLAGAFRALGRAVLAVIGPRAQHHHMPSA